MTQPDTNPDPWSTDPTLAPEDLAQQHASYPDATPVPAAPVAQGTPGAQGGNDSYSNGYAQPTQSADYGYGQPPTPVPPATPPAPSAHYGTYPPAAAYGASDSYGSYGAPAYGYPGQQSGQPVPPQQPVAPGMGGGYGAPPAYGDYGHPAPGTNWSGEPPINQPYYGISFGLAVQRFFKKYATFSGRASRSEFWWAYLFMVIVGGGLNILDGVLNTMGFLAISNMVGFLATVWGMAILVPSIAIYVRRLHDANKPGTMAIIPYALYGVGTVVLFVTLGGVIFALASNPSSTDIANGAIAGMLGGIVLFLLLYLAGFIVWVIFAVKASDPAGVRFDR